MFVTIMELSMLECDPHYLFKELRAYKHLAYGQIAHYLRHPDGHYVKLVYEFHDTGKNYYVTGDNDIFRDEHHIKVTFKDGSPIKARDLPKYFHPNGVRYELQSEYTKIMEAFMYLRGLGYQWTVPTEKKHPTNHGPFFKEYFNLDGVEVTREGQTVDKGWKRKAELAKDKSERIVENFHYFNLARIILNPNNPNVAIFGGFARELVSSYHNASRATKVLWMIWKRPGSIFKKFPREIIKHLSFHVMESRFDPEWCLDKISDIDMLINPYPQHSPKRNMDFMDLVEEQCERLQDRGYEIMYKKQGDEYQGRQRNGGYLHCSVTIQHPVTERYLKIDMVSVFEDMILDTDVNSLILRNNWQWIPRSHCPVPIQIIIKHIRDREFITINEVRKMYYRVQHLQEKGWKHLNSTSATRKDKPYWQIETEAKEPKISRTRKEQKTREKAVKEHEEKQKKEKEDAIKREQIREKNRKRAAAKKEKKKNSVQKNGWIVVGK